jgi:hypothetical protein
MRLFWAGFLTTGLFLIGFSTYERRQSADDGATSEAVFTATEDGSPWPRPYPTPKTR